jgi:hypothetical protein
MSVANRFVWEIVASSIKKFNWIYSHQILLFKLGENIITRLVKNSYKNTLVCFSYWYYTILKIRSSSATELANASVNHPRDPNSNLGKERKYLIVLFVWHLNSNLEGVNSWPIMLDPLGMLQKPLTTGYICLVFRS